MRAKTTIVLLLCLLGCSQDEITDELICGPNGECPSGFMCNDTSRRCVARSLTPHEDAAEPDAEQLPDAMIAYDAHVPEPDAPIVYDAALPDASIPDAQIAYDAPTLDAAPPDALPPDAQWVTFEVTVLKYGAPVNHAPVVTHDPTGSVLRTQAETDSKGKVTLMAEPGSWVTGRWQKGSWMTVVGIQEGDSLTIGSGVLDLPTSETRDALVTVAEPFGSSQSYVVGIRDKSLSGMFPCRSRSSDEMPVSEVLVYSYGCLNSDSALAYATALDLDDEALAYATRIYDTRTINQIDFAWSDWKAAKALPVTATNFASWMRRVEIDTPFDSEELSTATALLNVPVQFNRYKAQISTINKTEESSFLLSSGQLYSTLITAKLDINLGEFLLSYSNIIATSKDMKWHSSTGNPPAGQFISIKDGLNVWEFVCSSEMRDLVLPPMPDDPKPISSPSRSILRVEGFRSQDTQSYDVFRENFMHRGSEAERRTTWIERSANEGG